jgi:hypothetical protein
MRDLESLTAAMAMVPLLFSRNRMFALFSDPVVRRARNRARMVRGVLRIVSRGDVDVNVSTSGERAKIAYRVERLRLSRVVMLTDFELALLRVLLAKGPHPSALAEEPGDRARVDEAIARLPREEARSA